MIIYISYIYINTYIYRKDSLVSVFCNSQQVFHKQKVCFLLTLQAGLINLRRKDKEN